MLILLLLKDSGYSSTADQHSVMSVRVSPLLLFNFRETSQRRVEKMAMIMGRRCAKVLLGESPHPKGPIT